MKFKKFFAAVLAGAVALSSFSLSAVAASSETGTRTNEPVKIELATSTSTGAALEEDAGGSAGSNIDVPTTGVDGLAIKKVVVEFDADKITTDYFNGIIGANKTGDDWYQSEQLAYPENNTWSWDCADGIVGNIQVQFWWINKVQDDTNTPGTVAIKSVTMYDENDIVLAIAEPKAATETPDPGEDGDVVKIELATSTSTGAALEEDAGGSAGSNIDVPTTGVDGLAIKKVVVEFDADKITTDYFNGIIGANKTGDDWYQSEQLAYPENNTWSWDCADGIVGNIQVQFWWINKVQDDTNTPGTVAIKSVTMYDENDIVLAIAEPKTATETPDPGEDDVDTSTWKPAANGFTTAWGGWKGCSADAGTLNYTCTIKDVMNAISVTDIADFGGFIAQVWNGTVGAEVSYTVIIEAADGTQKAKDSGTTTTVDNDGIPETNLKQYATEACGGNMVFAATDKIKIAVAAGDTPPEIPDDEPGQEETTKTLTLTVIDASGWGKPDVQKAAQKNTSMTPTGFTVGATKYGDVKNATVKLNGAEITNISIPGVDLTDSENITFSLYAQWGDNWTWTSGAADGWNMSDITGVADSDVLKEFGYQINVNGTVGGINDMTLGDTITVTIKYTDFVATGISGGDTPGGDNPGGDTPGTPSIPSRPSTPSEPEETVKFEDGKNETGAVVEAPKDAFEKPDDITFNAASVAEETKDEIFTFDLSFTDKDGNKVQPKSAVTVKLPVPAALTGKTVYVYHVEENGTYTEISCKVENGMVVFSAKSFSTYVITSQKLNANGEPVADQPGTTDPGTNNPGNTNEPNVNTGVGSVAVVLGVTAVAAGAMIVSKKRK